VYFFLGLGISFVIAVIIAVQLKKLASANNYNYFDDEW
jgi:hypothetical protein